MRRIDRWNHPSQFSVRVSATTRFFGARDAREFDAAVAAEESRKDDDAKETENSNATCAIFRDGRILKRRDEERERGKSAIGGKSGGWLGRAKRIRLNATNGTGARIDDERKRWERC